MFQFGFANVSLGCPLCNCNISGSIQQFCDTHTGQCPCKMGVDGLKCDECFDGFFGLSEDGCQGKNETNYIVLHLDIYIVKKI